MNATVEQPWLRRSIRIGALGSAAAVAWARVEAREHYPVDVLVSAALSNFIVRVFYQSIGSEDQTWRSAHVDRSWQTGVYGKASSLVLTSMSSPIGVQGNCCFNTASLVCKAIADAFLSHTNTLYYRVPLRHFSK